MNPYVGHVTNALSNVTKGCRIVHFKPLRLVWDINSDPSRVYIITKGLIRFSILNSDGAERLMFYGKPGCIVGDILRLSRREDAEDFAGIRAVAVEVCEAAVMSDTEFLERCIREPELASVTITQAYQKIECLVQQLDQATFRDATRQVAGLLLALLRETRKNDGDEVRIVSSTHQMIASDTGKTRVTVTCALNSLQDVGAIRLRRGRIEILNEKMLVDRVKTGREDCVVPPLADRAPRSIDRLSSGDHWAPQQGTSSRLPSIHVM